MELRLDLSRHCIETAARLKLEHLIRACLKSPDQETEIMIEALICFLSSNDFGDLRQRVDKARKAGQGPALPRGDDSGSHSPLSLPEGAAAPFSRLDLGPDSCILTLPPDVSF